MFKHHKHTKDVVQAERSVAQNGLDLVVQLPIDDLSSPTIPQSPFSISVRLISSLSARTHSAKFQHIFASFCAVARSYRGLYHTDDIHKRLNAETRCRHGSTTHSAYLTRSVFSLAAYESTCKSRT